MVRGALGLGLAVSFPEIDINPQPKVIVLSAHALRGVGAERQRLLRRLTPRPHLLSPRRTPSGSEADAVFLRLFLTAKHTHSAAISASRHPSQAAKTVIAAPPPGAALAGGTSDSRARPKPEATAPRPQPRKEEARGQHGSRGWKTHVRTPGQVPGLLRPGHCTSPTGCGRPQGPDIGSRPGATHAPSLRAAPAHGHAQQVAEGPNCPSASRMSFPDVPATSALWRPWWPATEVERETTAGAADSQGCLSLGLITEDPLGAAPETTQLPFPGSSGGPAGALQQPGKEHRAVSIGTRWTCEQRAGVSRKLLCVKKQRKETGWGAGRGPVCHVNQAGSQVQVGARWWAPDPAPTPPTHPWPSPPSSSSRG